MLYIVYGSKPSYRIQSLKIAYDDLLYFAYEVRTNEYVRESLWTMVKKNHEKSFLNRLKIKKRIIG